MKYGKLTTFAILVTTVLASTLMAATNKANLKMRSHQLDPMIIELIERAETGTMNGFNVGGSQSQVLPPRKLNRKLKPVIGMQRDNTRLQIKFMDELRVRIDEDGHLFSKTNRSIDEIAEIAESFELTFTRCINRSEEDIETLMDRAERHARVQTPDIGALYWIDGSNHNLGAAASAFHAHNDVEYVFWNTIFVPENHISDRPSIFSDVSIQMANDMIAAQEHMPTITILRGACFVNRGICESNISNDACKALGGTYLGNDSVCEDDSIGDDRGGAVGACCFILVTAPAPTGAALIPGCMDSVAPPLGDGITKAQCQSMTAPFVQTNNIYAPLSGAAPPTNANGVWVGGSDCPGIATGCVLTPIPPGATACAVSGESITVFSGDCYHDQSDPALGWTNRVTPNPFGATFAPGCWDAPGFPLVSPTNFEVQGCCDAVSVVHPNCAVVWDAMCANYANSPAFSSVCFNSPGLSGASGTCSSPWGPNQRPYPVDLFDTAGTQRMVLIGAGATITDVTVGFPPLPLGCGWSVPAPGVDPIIPGQPTFAPVAAGATTPDYSAILTGASLGIVQHCNIAGIAPATVTTSLLQWPMGGAQVGQNAVDPGNANLLNTAFLPPLTEPGTPGGARFNGSGLNLFSVVTAPSGIGNGNTFGGLYGAGFRKQVETGFTNGTHGLGVKVAVLDYSAFIQTYNNQVGTLIGGVHEDLPTVLLEGPQTGHDALQMLFNPPDVTDFPFDFGQSPNHGTAQLGVIAASWNGVTPTTGAGPGTNFGAMGLAPDATTAFYPLIDLESVSDGSGGRAATAWFNAMEWLVYGDVLSAAYLPLDNYGDFANLSFNPAINTLIQSATNLGITVVVNAGDSGVDLSGSEFPNEIDPMHISVCATTPGGSLAATNGVKNNPAKRWADSIIGSSFVAGSIDTARNTCAAWGAGVTTTGMGPGQDNWLGYKTITYNNGLNAVEVAGRSYTNNYSGTSAAASIVAGLCVDIQGYCRQVFQQPLSPMLMRQYAAHGQVLGSDPDTGALLLSTINAADTATNVSMGTDNAFASTAWPGGLAGGFGWDTLGVAAGAGNIVGYFCDPRYAVNRITVDPLFDNPNVAQALFIRGDYLEGNDIALANADGIFLAAVSEHTAGPYSTPPSVPGGNVGSLLEGEITDLYFGGIATDPRGNPLLSLENMTLSVAVAPLQAPITLMQLWMWDFTANNWIKTSLSASLVAASTEQDFEIVRAQNLLDSDGQFHARLLTWTGYGPFDRFPIYYDQVLLNPTIPSTGP